MNYNEEERKKIRKQYDIENNFVYGYIGRISKEKGVLELIRAYKKVVKNNNNVKLMIIGDTLFNNSKNKYCMDIEKEISDIKDSIILAGSIKNELINRGICNREATIVSEWLPDCLIDTAIGKFQTIESFIEEMWGGEI